MPLLTFDIEISNVFDLTPGEDLCKYAPFDISVAATHVVGGEECLWLSKSASGVPETNMARDKAGELLHYLDAKQREGHSVVAWNGLSFDLRWIGHVAQDLPTARRIALKLYDPMYQFFKLKGFPVGLAKVGEGMGIATKKLMAGADAPKHWRAGRHDLVCEYVLGDVRLTAEVANAITKHGHVRWITQRGSPSLVPMPRLRTVKECMADPMPDQTWMSSPIPDEQFTGWLNG